MLDSKKKQISVSFTNIKNLTQQFWGSSLPPLKLFLLRHQIQVVNKVQQPFISTKSPV